MQDPRTKLVSELAKDCKTMDDVQNMLRDLFRIPFRKY